MVFLVGSRGQVLATEAYQMRIPLMPFGPLNSLAKFANELGPNGIDGMKCSTQALSFWGTRQAFLTQHW